MNLNTERDATSFLAYLKDPKWHKGGKEGEKKESCNIWKRLCAHRRNLIRWTGQPMSNKDYYKVIL